MIKTKLKRTIKYITGKTLQPVLMKYLSKKRVYNHLNGLQLVIAPGVFHPAFFFSTKILLKFISTLPLEGKTLLELGAGSGLIAFSAAKNRAIVTATDINKTAVEYLKINSKNNKLSATVLHSDLFSQIPQQYFDYILINPPYYKKQPQNEAQHAWYCGENSEYFSKLFSTMGNYIHQESKVFMILNDECDITLIMKIAGTYHFRLYLEQTTNAVIEQLYIFSIKPMLTHGIDAGQL